MEHFSHTMDPSAAAAKARELIAGEVSLQSKHAHKDSSYTKAQMLGAAMAHVRAVEMVSDNVLEWSREALFDASKAMYFPASWSGFRDYGSDIANLVVAAAYIENEIKRRLMIGEDATRTARGEPLPEKKVA